MATIINLTPHAVGFYQNGIEIVNWPSEGQVRLEEIDSNHDVVEIGGIEVTTCERIYGDGSLPAQRDGVMLLVSGLVCEAFPERRDLYFPAFDVRDKDGKFVGTTCLCQVPAP